MSSLIRQIRREKTMIGVLEKICYAATGAVAVLWSLYMFYALICSVVQAG